MRERGLYQPAGHDHADRSRVLWQLRGRIHRRVWKRDSFGHRLDGRGVSHLRDRHHVPDQQRLCDGLLLSALSGGQHRRVWSGHPRSTERGRRGVSHLRRRNDVRVGSLVYGRLVLRRVRGRGDVAVWNRSHGGRWLSHLSEWNDVPDRTGMQERCVLCADVRASRDARMR
jgi:hypothetical protein